jgi:hypothetical protein
MWFDGLGFDRGSPLFAIGQPRPVYGMNEAKVYLLGSANRHTSYEEPEERDGVRRFDSWNTLGPICSHWRAIRLTLRNCVSLHGVRVCQLTIKGCDVCSEASLKLCDGSR